MNDCWTQRKQVYPDEGAARISMLGVGHTGREGVVRAR